MRESVRWSAIARSTRLLPVVPRDRRAVVGAFAVVVALLSAAHSGGYVWRRLGEDRARYAAMTEAQRRHALVEQLGAPGDPFDFFAANVGRGDRVYYQVRPSGLGHFLDLPETVEAVGRYYLLPAVSAPDLQDATVVVTWEADPATLHLRFAEQHQAGVQRLFVSRIAR